MQKATLSKPKLTYSLVLIAALAGCSSMASLPEGTPYQTVLSEYGTPNVQCNEDNTTLRVWSQQPMGYYAWRGVFDANDQLLDMQQILNDPAFAQLEPATGHEQWDKERVWCNFGPPAEQARAPYIGVMMPVWTYRYKQNSVWPMMMNIFFDEQEQVHAIQRSMDPRDDDGLFWFGH